MKGRDVQVVEGGRDVAHESHQEDGDLEDVVLNKDETVDDLVVPGDMVEGEDEREEPEEDADAVCLRWSVLDWGGCCFGGAHKDGYEDANGNTGGDGIGGLFVVFRGEELGVLEGSVGWDQSVSTIKSIHQTEKGDIPPTPVSWMPRRMALRSKWEMSKYFLSCCLDTGGFWRDAIVASGWVGVSNSQFMGTAASELRALEAHVSWSLGPRCRIRRMMSEELVGVAGQSTGR